MRGCRNERVARVHMASLLEQKTNEKNTHAERLATSHKGKAGEECSRVCTLNYLKRASLRGPADNKLEKKREANVEEEGEGLPFLPDKAAQRSKRNSSNSTQSRQTSSSQKCGDAESDADHGLRRSGPTSCAHIRDEKRPENSAHVNRRRARAEKLSKGAETSYRRSARNSEKTRMRNQLEQQHTLKTNTDKNERVQLTQTPQTSTGPSSAPYAERPL